MLNFRQVRESDREAVEKIMGSNPSRISEFCPSDFIFWGLTGDAEVAFEGDDLYIRWHYGEERGYAYPFAADEDAALEKIVSYSHENCEETLFVVLSEEQAKKIEKKYDVEAECERDWCDYLYSAESLATLSGKKLHGQKNHYNRFLKDYPQYEFRPYTLSMREKAMAFAKEYYAQEVRSGLLFDEEKEVFLSRLARPNEKEKSGVLFVDGKVVAITFGEVLGDTLYVHSEKALREYPGSYVAVNTNFVNACKKECPWIEWVNREEDHGQEGLRRAKESWHPERLVEKYFVTVE